MKAAKLVVAGMLLLALVPLPYAYYTLLRWVVTGVSGYSAYVSFNEDSIGWALTFAVVAILFNPFVPFYMEKESWAVLDLAAAVLFGISAFVSRDR